MRASSIMLLIAWASLAFGVFAVVGLSISKPWLMLTWIPLGLILWLIYRHQERRNAPAHAAQAAAASSLLAEQRAARTQVHAAIVGMREDAQREYNARLLRGIHPHNLDSK